MSQSLFSAFHSPDPDPKPPGDRPVKMQVLVTVKAAPNPSETYGETVCVAGVRADMTHPGFVRLYPINFRDLDSDDKFGKYQIITLEATPARQDQRRESWRPVLSSIEPGESLKPWKPRRVWLDDYIETSMCQINADARERHDAKSLALIKPKEITDLVFENHPGWTPDEQRKIDKYVAQPELYSPREKTPLQPPRFKGRYRYRCFEATCRGHEQGLLDWEFVMLQRQLAGHPAPCWPTGWSCTCSRSLRCSCCARRSVPQRERSGVGTGQGFRKAGPGSKWRSLRIWLKHDENGPRRQ